MTPQYILRRSLCREPHCFSAHVPGKGYVNRGQTIAERPEFLRQYRQSAESEIENMMYAPGYAEPGYDEPKRGVLFANWNVFPTTVADLLEQAGYGVEWSDEWTICSDCERAVRTQPDSHGWRPIYSVDENDVTCQDCLQERYPTVEDL